MEDISQGLEVRPIPYDPCDSSANDSFPAEFRYVWRNIPGPGCARDLFEEQLRGCDCLHACHQDTCSCLQRFGPNYHPHTGQLTPEAGASSTLKPVLECNSQCACDAGCSNRMVQHGPRVKLKVSPAGMRGFGLFACEDIRQLTFVCEYAGEVVGSFEAGKRMENKEGGMNYLIVLREHCHTGIVLTCVDPQHFGNVGRFANHSCDPNLLMVPVRVDNSIPKLALFARRNIGAGEELTFDYSGESVLNGVLTPGIQTTVDQCKSKFFKRSETSLKDEKSVTPTDSYLGERNGESCGNCGKRVVESDVRPGICDVNVEPADSTSCARCRKCLTWKDDGEDCRKDCPPQVADADLTDRKKRKRSQSEDGVKTKSKNQLFEQVSQAKHGGVDPGAEVNQTVLKTCLCGTSMCKGYLPFDPLIFKS